MGKTTGIEWADSTLNFVFGCTMVSLGCVRCYMFRLEERIRGIKGNVFALKQLPLRYANFDKKLAEVKSWKEPRIIFVNSMSDTFHESIPFMTIDMWFNKVFSVFRQHQFLLLTKRANRMRAYFKNRKCPDNVWLGVSVETADYVHRIRALEGIDCSVRFLSVEPMLGAFPAYDLAGNPVLTDKIHWVIAGGESDYTEPRHCKLSWLRDLRDQCDAKNIPFFLKQLGGTMKCTCCGAWGCRKLDNLFHDELPKQKALDVYLPLR